VVLLTGLAIPPEGRVGLARAGEFAGCYLLVTLEWNSVCIIYIAAPTAAESGLNTDLRANPDGLPALVEEWEIQWLSPEEDVSVEAELFGIREHWARVAQQLQLPWWRRLLAGPVGPPKRGERH
jgi:hypothetical protein